MEYGYVRISTKRQSKERQIRNIKSEYPNAYIVEEIYTGTKIDRPNFKKLLGRLKPQDTLIFDSASRMSRSAEDGFKLYEELYNKGIKLVFLKEPYINSDTFDKAKERVVPMTGTNVDYILNGINRYLLEIARSSISLAFEVAQKEVDALRQRTKEGLITAKLKNRQLGHKKNTPLIHKQSIIDKEIILKNSKTFGGSLSDVDTIKLCKCSRKSYYKYKKELLLGHNPMWFFFIFL